ncbi:amidohydrolase family protein [Ramlibacter humi]|uniref:Cytosine deaminase n=1 Tax=Ramlibacter humi TaxID=2530451 RepID=A0A4Z0CAF6_9BURK|nr:amidohydrolase family protein [Ramlibacter humi]TFZ07994.1 cytosine deaminase [Ramlibacter humi]
MAELLLRNVRLPRDGAAVDVRVEGERIAAVAPDLAPREGEEVIEGKGGLLLPGFVESHAHLDKTLWGLPWRSHAAGGRLENRIEDERRFRAESGHDAGRQAMALALAFLERGTTRIRTHVDVDTGAGLRHLQGVLEARQRLRDVMELQVVAFPQSGLLMRPGTADLLRAAMREGAEVLGGLDPQGIDGDAAASLDLLFGIADEAGCGLDIHLHEPGEGGARTLDAILDRVQALGLQGRVAISHGFCIGEVEAPRRAALLDRMARLQIAAVTVGTPYRGVPSLLECREAGVVLAAGNDGIRDAWTPYGSPDMLERAMLVGWRNNLRRDEELGFAFDAVTSQGALACGFSDYGLQPGCIADLVVVDARHVPEAVVVRPRRELVISRGRIVVREGVPSASATILGFNTPGA